MRLIDSSNLGVYAIPDLTAKHLPKRPVLRVGFARTDAEVNQRFTRKVESSETSPSFSEICENINHVFILAIDVGQKII